MRQRGGDGKYHRCAFRINAGTHCYFGLDTDRRCCSLYNKEVGSSLGGTKSPHCALKIKTISYFENRPTLADGPVPAGALDLERGRHARNFSAQSLL